MIKSYLKIAWRNLLKDKVFSLVNILGLTIGITLCMMIFLFIVNEFSVDKFHKQHDHIYRVMRKLGDAKQGVPYLSGPYAPALLNDFPGIIERAVRVMPSHGMISFGDRAFNEKNIYFADKDFFQLFSFPLVRGNAQSVLNGPTGVVLSESTAKKYFGSVENALGKVVDLDKRLHFRVTGIAKDIPSNSHLSFDLVFPIEVYASESWFNVWMNNNLFTYVLLAPGVKKDQLESRFSQFTKKYMKEEINGTGTQLNLSLTPLTDIYFEPAAAFDHVKHGDKNVVHIFMSVAVLILLIGCINFMNLSTIRGIGRSKEVGLRKVLGAARKQLLIQFIGESVLLSAIASVLSLGLLQILLPIYEDLLDSRLTVPWNSGCPYVFFGGIILITGFIAGSYPALFLSAFPPVNALKGKLQLGSGGIWFRQLLVVVQFCISVFLIAGTIVIVKQMNYIKNKDLGYEEEQRVVIPLDNDDIAAHRDAFKTLLGNQDPIASVSLMSGEPGGFFDMHTFEAEGQREMFRARTEFADIDFVKTLGLKIIAGRDFSSKFGTDSSDAVLINRTAAEKLGLTPRQALGKWLRNTLRDSTRRRIVGVVQDFNFLSLRENMDALVISPSPDRRVAVIKLKPGNVGLGIKTIKNLYSELAPVYPFEYSFLDQKFDTVYKNDIRQKKMLTIFALVAVFVACLGLFGLASYTTARRTKEIGVRKVLGSSERRILFMLSGDLLRPVLVAVALATPLGYFAMVRWLQNFAYRTHLSWWVFALAALITLAIALLTVSIKALKAATASPAKSLGVE